MALLLGESRDGEEVLKAGPLHGAEGCVDFVTCQLGGYNVADPCEGLVLAVCQLLCKEAVQSKAESQCALTYGNFDPGYGGKGS